MKECCDLTASPGLDAPRNTRVVVLPGGNQCSAIRYFEAWRALKQVPPDTLVEKFNWYPTRADDILRTMKAGMHRRINDHIPGHGRGRKWHQEWQLAAWRTARAVNTPRLIVRTTTVPPEFRARLAHRLTDPSEL